MKKIKLNFIPFSEPKFFVVNPHFFEFVENHQTKNLEPPSGMLREKNFKNVLGMVAERENRGGRVIKTKGYVLIFLFINERRATDYRDGSWNNHRLFGGYWAFNQVTSLVESK